MDVNIKECEAAGLDPKDIKRIAKGLSRYSKQADELGMIIFGGSGTGTLRFQDDDNKGDLIIAYLDGWYDGGDGGQTDFGDNLMCGER